MADFVAKVFLGCRTKILRAADAFCARRDRISTSVLSVRLPTIHPAREFVEAGGLMSYGASSPDTFRRAADYIDKILIISKRF
jgi:hypothetical protein